MEMDWTSRTTRPISRGCWRRPIATPDSADLALGSRYVPGGGVATGGFCGASSARAARPTRAVVLGLKVRDLTGGFKCFRREVLEAIHFDSRALAGLCLPGRADLPRRPAGFRVVEVPITFRDREHGQSKMHWRIAVEAMWLVPMLRFG